MPNPVGTIAGIADSMVRLLDGVLSHPVEERDPDLMRATRDVLRQFRDQIGKALREIEGGNGHH